MSFKQSLFAGAALSLIAANAYATEPEDCPPGEGEEQTLNVHTRQIQFGETRAREVIEAFDVGHAFGSAIAAGNLVTAAAPQVDADSEQYLKASVSSTAEAWIASADGQVGLAATSAGNGLTMAATRGDLDLRSHQFAREHISVDATARGLVKDAESVVAASTTSVNAVAASAAHGDLYARSSQQSGASAEALTDIDVWSAETYAVASSTAAGNSAAYVAAYGDVDIGVHQVQYGDVIAATTDLNVGAAQTAYGAASAAANTLALDVSHGDARAQIGQQNASDVAANSFVFVGDAISGDAASVAMGVGNSAALFAYAGSMNAGLSQENFGAVNVASYLYGEVGGVASNAATAIGNAANFGVCANCGDATLNGHVTQYNAGPVHAFAGVNTHAAGHIVNTATAIGNTAAFSITQNGGGD